MAATDIDYKKMYGNIVEEAVVMAKCNCISCNGNCLCRSCRNIPDLDELDWE